MSIKPFVEVPSVVNDPTPELQIFRASTEHTALRKRAFTQTEILGRLRRTEFVNLVRMHCLASRGASGIGAEREETCVKTQCAGTG